jgi:transposase-like protein
MSKKFSTEFKEQVVKKVLQRTTNQSVRSIAKDSNVGFSTLTAWMAEYRAKSTMVGQQSKRPQDWTKEERFAILMASGTVEVDELERFCRNKGLFQHHLETWKNEFLNATNTMMQKSTDRKLNTRIQELEREIARNNKVIVEQAALLVLGKKISAFWEEKKGS